MVGRTISHYRVDASLGAGGMGEVFRAEDLKLGRQVALKFLADNLVSEPEIQKRFEREAKAAAGLSHPNICMVYEIDQADGKTFLAMELVEGDSLDSLIDKGPLPLIKALDIAGQLAKGLDEAHTAGVVHRDIKPGNILVKPDGHVKIVDFGLALLSEASKLTKLETTVGTVAYMSPEQAQGGEVDHRTDVWALGCVLYEMVCGRRAFQGQYDQALLYEIVNEAHEPITALRAGVPVELDFIVGKCLEKDREKRYAGAAELATDLARTSDQFKSGRSVVSAVSAPQVKEESPVAAGQGRFFWPALAGILALALVAALCSPSPKRQRPSRTQLYSRHGVPDRMGCHIPERTLYRGRAESDSQ